MRTALIRRERFFGSAPPLSFLRFFYSRTPVLPPPLDIFLCLPPVAPEGSPFVFFLSSASANQASAALRGASISKKANTRLF